MASKRQTQREKPYEVVDFVDIDTSCISFGAPKENKYGSLMIPIKYNGKKLYVKYPRSVVPFGIGENTEMANPNKVTGYTLSMSFGKDYESNDVYKKAQEIDQFFIDACHENAVLWRLGKVPRNIIEGFDEQGDNGKWKRIVKWSSKRNKQTNERIYNFEHPPRHEIAVPAVLTDNPTDDNPDHRDAKFTSMFFDEAGDRYSVVDNTNYESVCPKWSDASALAAWPRLTQGTYGVTMKPQAQQVRVYPREELATDECLLDDEEEDQLDELDEEDCLGGSGVVKAVPVESPADDVVVEYGDNASDTEEVPVDDTEEVAVEATEEVVPVKPKRVVRRVVKK